MRNARMVSVGRVARARSGRAARARLRARSPSGIFWGAPFFFRAREEKNLEGSKKPYGRGAIAPGATFARARTCSSLVIRLDAIVNLRWLCEKRDSGGRGKPRLVCDRQLSAPGNRRGSGRKAWIFFHPRHNRKLEKRDCRSSARFLCSRISRILLTRKQSDFSPVPVPGDATRRVDDRDDGKKKKANTCQSAGNSGHSVPPRAHQVRKTRACRLFLDLSTDLSTFPPINRTHPPQQPRQKMKISAALISLFVALAATGASAQLANIESDKVFELHGSGTTNPQRFFWKVMDILEERAANPIKLTYRGVGACPRPVNSD